MTCLSHGVKDGSRALNFSRLSVQNSSILLLQGVSAIPPPKQNKTTGSQEATLPLHLLLLSKSTGYSSLKSTYSIYI